MSQEKLTPMDIKISYSEKNLSAIFSVEQIDNNVYNLRLKSFEGENKPPLFIKIHKTSDGWISAFNDASMIHNIGMAIDTISV
jgi:hypothetical protein